MKRWYIRNGMFSSREFQDSTVFEVDEDATGIVIPEGVTKIGYSAFSQCTE